MARSYKKSPCCTDRPNGAKYWKNLGNRKVRHLDDLLPKGNKYKKVYNSWKIHDYVIYWDKKQALEYFRRNRYLKEDYKNEEEFLNRYWKKYQYRK